MSYQMQKVCVFCGSSSGFSDIYRKAAEDVADTICGKGLELVYGGGNIGIMGIIADRVLKGGGNVTGVIPHFLAEKEVGHSGLTELIFVDSMHERKQKMSEIADAFIALPGGFGTLEELAEILTWAQLGLVQKPVGLLNVNSFFNGLLEQLDLMVDQGFLNKENRALLISGNDINSLFSQLEAYEASDVPKWISRDET